MKQKNARSMLVAGLALALSMVGTSLLQGASVALSKSARASQNQLDSIPAPIPAPGGLPSLSPTPSAPNVSPLPSNPAPLQPVPDPKTWLANPPASNNAPSIQSAPPGMAPTNRVPLGMFYGEQERLDNLNNQSTKPRPLPVGPAPYPFSSPSMPQGNVGVPYESIPQGSPVIGDGSAIFGSPTEMPIWNSGPERFGFAPPPGTLGQTYKRRSRPIEETKHPRVGAVEVHLPESVDVSAKGLKTKWTGKLWRLESDPLLPGIPHIFEINASWGEKGEPQVRTIRLIMGRIVELDF